MPKIDRRKGGFLTIQALQKASYERATAHVPRYGQSVKEILQRLLVISTGLQLQAPQHEDVHDPASVLNDLVIQFLRRGKRINQHVRRKDGSFANFLR